MNDIETSEQTNTQLNEDTLDKYIEWIEENCSDDIDNDGKIILYKGKAYTLKAVAEILAPMMKHDIGVCNKVLIKTAIEQLLTAKEYIKQKKEEQERFEKNQENGVVIADKFNEEYESITNSIEEMPGDWLELFDKAVDEIESSEFDKYKEWLQNTEYLYLHNVDGERIGIDDCYSNIIEWLDNYPYTKGKLLYDNARLKLYWNNKPLCDEMIHKIMQMCNKSFSKRYSNPKTFYNAIYGYATKCHINTAYDYFMKLKYVEDGVDYIEKMIKEVLCCEDVDKYYELYYEELKLHCIAAFKRIMMKEKYNKCFKFDQILTLCAEKGGSGKTTFFERLYDFYNDSDSYCYIVNGDQFKPGEKDFVIQTQGNSCVCIDEINIKRNIVPSIKSYISQHTDVFRKPYGIMDETSIRGFVIGATSNNTDFLKDYTAKTLERRWWIIHVSENPDNSDNVNKAFDEGIRDKFWAQIKHICDTESNIKMWISEGSELGNQLEQLQKSYNFYNTSEDYNELINVINNSYCTYKDSHDIGAREIVEQYSYFGSSIEWAEQHNAALNNKKEQYGCLEPADRYFDIIPTKLDYITVKTLNEVADKLKLSCTPQGLAKTLNDEWCKKVKRIGDKTYLCYVRKTPI